MLFNSYQFLIFFPVVLAFYYALPHRHRWAMLLLASCIFYMAFIPIYILILLITIVIDYLAGILIERSEGHRRRVYLVISIVSTCLVLFVFKYFNFFTGSLRGLMGIFHRELGWTEMAIILPIGLSFHTFQSLSYVIEVYFHRQKAERHFGIYSLYVMFFPQLVAGPIERPSNLLTQLREEKTFDHTEFTEGLKLMMWGMFKKVVIADRLALYVNDVYGHPQHFPGPALLLATLFFAIQIYCDFSGYSDIAIGSAQTMGIHLMKNFDRPYLSRNIQEFWQRWHISLSTWFRDYVYIPLGGSRVSRSRWITNIFITFVISGLWHGANWTFVIWGALHGTFMVCSVLTKSLREKILKSIGLEEDNPLLRVWQVGFTFSLVCLGWIFFRAPDVPTGFFILTHLFHGVAEVWNHVGHSAVYWLDNFCPNRLFSHLIGGAAAIAFFLLAKNFESRAVKDFKDPGLSAPLTWSIYFIGVMVIMNMGITAEIPFIYFQF